MRVEYYVRVRDDDDRLWHNDADDVYDPHRRCSNRRDDVNQGPLTPRRSAPQLIAAALRASLIVAPRPLAPR
jgi:hypothetical protein